MNERQQTLLKLVIEGYIKTGEPLSSKFLSENTKLSVSGATIRNELRDLEEKGYLTHRHTSAGRIPTELGYKWYIEQMYMSDPTKAQKKRLEQASKELDKEYQLKQMAKEVAALSSLAVIVSFGKNKVYYTGISYLLSQKEFKDYQITLRVSKIFDNCEEKIVSIHKHVSKEKTPKIFIGSDNPLDDCSSLIAIKLPEDTIVSIYGPMRMDYAEHVGLLSYIHKLLK